MKLSYHEQLLDLLKDLRLLGEKAQRRGDFFAPGDGFVPDYWYGVAAGYQDASDRLAALLEDKPE